MTKVLISNKILIIVSLVFVLSVLLTPFAAADSSSDENLIIRNVDMDGIERQFMKVNGEWIENTGEKYVLIDGEWVRPSERKTFLEKAYDKAEYLKNLGLFMGTSEGFELERAPTRLEGLVMLVRLMGEEEEARNCTYKNPFTDIPTWGDRYAAWAYEKGYTTGTSATTFDPNRNMKAEEYFAFVLRALGYADDFVWPHSIEKAKEIGVVPADEYSDTTAPFLRADVAHISCLAINTTRKDSYLPLKFELLDLSVSSIARWDWLLFMGKKASDYLKTPGKAYHLNVSNNKMSSLTVSIDGNTLNVSCAEFTHGVSGMYYFISKDNGNIIATGDVKDSVSVNSIDLSRLSPGKYYINYENRTSQWITFRLHLKIEGKASNDWYIVGPEAINRNAYMTNLANKRPIADYLNNVPEGQFAKDLMAAMPRTSESDYQTAYDIYLWIINNIEYDKYANASDVFYNRTGVCSGYASLMCTALNMHGIPARYVAGYNFGYTQDGKKNNLIDELHAWVEFLDENGNWIICDPTWGDNNVTPNSWFDVSKEFIDYVRVIGYIS